MRQILEIKLNNELDVLAARQRTKQIAALCGFTRHEQTRLSTAVSELARRAMDEDRPGHIAFNLSGNSDPQIFVITITDRVSSPEALNSPDAGSELRIATKGTNSLSIHHFVDRIDSDFTADGTVVALTKACPQGTPYLDDRAIEKAMSELDPLPVNVVLSDTARQVREVMIKNDSISSENRQLHRQAGLLLSADQRKDEFLAILAHELRGPLSAVSMAAEILGKGASDPQQTASLGQLISRQAGHMSRIVEDLLDVSRIVRNEVSIEKEKVDLHDVLTTAVEQLKLAAQRRNHRVVVLHCKESAIVVGDRTRLIQIVSNLLGNAIRYTPEGGNIELSLVVQSGKLCLSVSDDGIGISAELLPGLFDMFKQVARSTDSRNSGLGLGLALVKTLVEAHEGTVKGYSDGPGCGSRFEVCLPKASVPSTID